MNLLAASAVSQSDVGRSDGAKQSEKSRLNDYFIQLHSLRQIEPRNCNFERSKFSCCCLRSVGLDGCTIELERLNGFVRELFRSIQLDLISAEDFGMGEQFLL